MIPDIEILLASYYAVQASIFPITIVVLLTSLILYSEGKSEGKKQMLYHVWRTGVEHTQKEYRNLFLKWKHDIREDRR